MDSSGRTNVALRLFRKPSRAIGQEALKPPLRGGMPVRELVPKLDFVRRKMLGGFIGFARWSDF